MADSRELIVAGNQKVVENVTAFVTTEPEFPPIDADFLVEGIDDVFPPRFYAGMIEPDGTPVYIDQGAHRHSGK
jgi:hypothetical protein